MTAEDISPNAPLGDDTWVTVVDLGLATTVQDAGRPGLAHSGIGRAGAADLPAFHLANRLVGNRSDAAVFETSGLLMLRFHHAALIALTGAEAASTWEHADSADSRQPVAHAAPTLLPANSLLRVAVPRQGLRVYIAVRGGLAVEPVIGSRSRDTLAGLGPHIASGSIVRVGPDPGSPILVDVAPVRTRSNMVRLLSGPRRDWFTDAAWTHLTSGPYVVGSATSRVGARLEGPHLERAVEGELPSEGLVLGAIQVPHDGQPIVMLADHPVTGGYPVIAVVHPDDVPVVAQAAPGAVLRFAEVH
jgi:biotin-dependent carboxylase-like uncharacterized protein